MSLVITGVLDGPLVGGLPKAVELYVTEDIADLSSFGLGSANNGGGSDGEEFTFPAIVASAGDFLYVASEAVGFAQFMGFAPDYTSGALAINGDDAVELFRDGSVIDVFGDPDADGTGLAWDYQDGWAARLPGTPASTEFDVSDWTFSGPGAFDGATSNPAAGTPFPLRRYDGAPTDPTAITINEIDSDQSGTDSAEFIEIYDGGIGNASLDGLTLGLYNGSNDMLYTSISLDGYTTDENGYFVVGSETVPNVDYAVFGGNLTLQNGPDAVAIYAGDAPAAPTTENLLDAVVYGTSDADDSGLLAALGQSAQADEDANGNSAGDALARLPDGNGDFAAQAPTPGATNVIAPPSEITFIHDIQGAVGTGDFAVIGEDDVSPLAGQTVTVSAIVTADFQDGGAGSMGDLNGFYVQEEITDYDMNDLTSEGVFIFDGSNPQVNVAYGDLVEVTGTVSEFNGQTQISATSVEIVAADQMVPDTVEVSFPTAGVMIDSDGGYVANLEAYEGMRVTIPQDMTVTELFNLDRFGQYNIASGERPVQFTQDNEPDVEGYDAHLKALAESTLVLDDGLTMQNPYLLPVIDGNDGVLTADDSFRMGDTLSNVTGVVGYSFDEFRINAPEGDYEQSNPRPAEPEDVGGNFKAASLNVLNYFTTIDTTGVTTDIGAEPRGADTAEEFERQAEKLVNAIIEIDADVLGLVEIENDFAGDTFAVKDLVARINAELGSETYAFVDPGQEFVGTDAIANALIYKLDAVAPVGDAAILESFEGRDFLDPLGAGSDLNRAAIAQTFEDLGTGETLVVSVNHLKSKGSLSGLEADEAQGDGQGNNNATRTAAAEILADWLDSDPTGQSSENVLILGDLNAYAEEDPIDALAEAGYTDLAAAELGGDAYSYVFDGQIGTLDYALANEALTEKLTGITEWHINADEADALDYNLDFGRDPTLFDGDLLARVSDHDPVLVGFEFEQAFELVLGTDKRDVLLGSMGRDRIEAGAGNDVIFASGGDDILIGGPGNDQLFGGAGDDTIIGGDGRNDRVFGGSGADSFVFSAAFADDGVKGRTTIYDFDAEEDIVDLDGIGIASIREGGGFVRITLEGDGDRIDLYGVGDFDDITFAGEVSVA